MVCGDAGDALGDSIYETQIYVRGDSGGSGADCVEKEMRGEQWRRWRALDAMLVSTTRTSGFRRYGSARNLYNFKIDNAGSNC